MAEVALRNNKSTQPTVSSSWLDSEADWNVVEFFIKWKGQSYLHCQWKSFSDLQNVRLLMFMRFLLDVLKFNLVILVHSFFKICCCETAHLFLPFWCFLYNQLETSILFYLVFQLSGFKKVLNYIKRVTEERKFRMTLSREEVISNLIFFCSCVGLAILTL